MAVRKAYPEDASKIANVHVESWRSTYRGLLPANFLESLSFRRRLELWSSTLAHNPDQVRVFEQGGNIIGFCSFGPPQAEDKPGTSELYTLYLLEPFQNQGSGKALFEEARITLKARGYKTLILWVLKTNQKARGFYEARGLSLDGREKTQTWNGTLLHEVCYRGLL